MEIILIALLVISVIAFIAYPLFSTSREKIVEETNGQEALFTQRESTYAALRDLDFDFQMGKLSESDHAALREKYKARAAHILQQIDALGENGAGAETDAQIEAQIAQLRRVPTSAGQATAQIETPVAQLRQARPDAVEAEIAQVRAARKSPALLCSRCGAPYQPGDRFCAKCGNPL